MVRLLVNVSARPWLWVLLGVAFQVFNVYLGSWLEAPVLAIIPIALATWHRGRKWGIAFALLVPGIRFVLYIITGLPVSLPVATFTFVNRVLVVLIMTFLIDRVAKQTRDLKSQVKTLEGILPICGFCKKIRDDREEWQPLEHFISSKSEARFSHCCCPPCMRKHYGDDLAESVL